MALIGGFTRHMWWLPHYLVGIAVEGCTGPMFQECFNILGVGRHSEGSTIIPTGSLFKGREG